jgi:hypothetical protein
MVQFHPHPPPRLQATLRSLLSNQGFTLQEKANLREHELDFVIVNFPGNSRFVSLGLRVAPAMHDATAQAAFLTRNADDHRRPVERSLYLELESSEDIIAGVMGALLEFQFNARLAATHWAGARVNSGGVYNLFDIAKNLTRLRQASVAAAPSSRPLLPRIPDAANSEKLLLGTIDTYFRNDGYGYVQSGEDRYFFHVNYLEDKELRRILNHLPSSTAPAPVQIDIRFVDGGYAKSGVRFREARKICMVPKIHNY